MENETVAHVEEEVVPMSAPTETGKRGVIQIKKKPLLYALLALVLIGLAGLAYASRDLFVVALVNGDPISRLAVVQELEKQGGKNTLESLITKKLIDDEAIKKGVTVTVEEINEEIQKIEAQLAGQGGTLELALAGQGMTLESLREQIVIQKQLEKILADSLAITDEEVEKFLTETNAAAQKGADIEALKNQAREQLKAQKFGQEAKAFVDKLKSDAKIEYLKQY